MVDGVGARRVAMDKLGVGCTAAGVARAGAAEVNGHAPSLGLRSVQRQSRFKPWVVLQRLNKCRPSRRLPSGRSLPR